MDESLPYRILYSTGVEQCKKCRLRIDNGFVQIAVMAQSNQKDDKFPVWYHRECFLKVRLPRSEAAFDGFAQLRYEHQIDLREELGIEIEPQAMSLEDEIYKQNKQYFAIYDYIAKNLPKADRFAILIQNGKTLSEAAIAETIQIIHQLSEIICFGVSEKCPKCRSGELRFSNWCYRCSNQSPWSTYCNDVNLPQRTLAKIPENMLKKHSFLEKNKGVRIRALHQFKCVDEDGNDIVYGPYKKPPLFNMEFILIGDFTVARADVERLIKKMGGKIATWVHARLAAVISNAHEIQKMDKQMTDARMYDIQVVSEDFLRECQSPDVDPIGYILSESICDWGGYAYDRIPECNDAVARMEAEFDDSLPRETIYKWKGGGAVDPECGLGENVHVYSTKIAGKTVYYAAILGYVDIQSNKNSYHRLQVLESNRQNMYWLYESWGRTGTAICSKNLQTCHTLQLAEHVFCAIYESKTGNTFNSKTFQKHPNKFYQLDVDIELPVKAPKILNQSNLSKPVYDLMEFLFDIKDLKSTMVGCDLDLKEMPLGKISTNQVRTAKSTLKNIYRLIQQGATVHELLAASNEFYTLIPHAVGINRPPIIRTIETVHAKSQLLQNILNVDMIQDFLDSDNAGSMHPFDLCYRKLHATIEPIEKHTVKFQQLCGIVRNTSQSFPQLEVLEIFEVQREAEIDRNGNCHINFKFRNHQLLWHGSRLLNFANILANGLKIAPAEALATGKQYGNGIYFTDAVSKAGGFCKNDLKNGVGLMILCDVALGIPKIGRAHGMPISSIDDGVTLTSHLFLPRGNVIYLPNDEFQSIQAFATDASIGYQEIDGVRIANGHSLLYGAFNEFVVFDPNQIKIKYLFKMKFFKN